MPTGDKIKSKSTVALFRRVYMHWHLYTYTKCPDCPIICSNGQAMSPALTRQSDSIAILSFGHVAFLRVRKRRKHNSREENGESQKFIGVRVHLRSLLHLQSAHIARSCYVSLDLQFKSRLDHVLKRWVTSLRARARLSVRGKGSVHGRNFIRLDKSDAELCEILFSVVREISYAITWCIIYANSWKKDL